MNIYPSVRLLRWTGLVFSGIGTITFGGNPLLDKRTVEKLRARNEGGKT
jgi:hypothetical protein